MSKTMAYGKLTKPDSDQHKSVMPAEVPPTLKMYLDGKMEQFWMRADGKAVFFLMNEDEKESRKILDQLPLAKAGFMEFDLIPVVPLSPLGMLIKDIL